MIATGLHLEDLLGHVHAVSSSATNACQTCLPRLLLSLLPSSVTVTVFKPLNGSAHISLEMIQVSASASCLHEEVEIVADGEVCCCHSGPIVTSKTIVQSTVCAHSLASGSSMELTKRLDLSTSSKPGSWWVHGPKKVPKTFSC